MHREWVFNSNGRFSAKSQENLCHGRFHHHHWPSSSSPVPPRWQVQWCRNGHIECKNVRIYMVHENMYIFASHYPRSFPVLVASSPLSPLSPSNERSHSIMSVMVMGRARPQCVRICWIEWNRHKISSRIYGFVVVLPTGSRRSASMDMLGKRRERSERRRMCLQYRQWVGGRHWTMDIIIANRTRRSRHWGQQQQRGSVCRMAKNIAPQLDRIETNALFMVEWLLIISEFECTRKLDEYIVESGYEEMYERA